MALTSKNGTKQVGADAGGTNLDISNNRGEQNSSGNPDPTDPVDHLFDGAPVNDRSGRAGDPEHLPSPSGDVATDSDGLARNNREAVRANLGTGKVDAEAVAKARQDHQAAVVADLGTEVDGKPAPTEDTKAAKAAPENK